MDDREQSMARPGSPDGGSADAGAKTEPAAADDGRGIKRIADSLLSDTFNSILRIEEKSLDNALTAGLSIAELHTIVAVGLYEENPMKVVAARLNVTLATLTAAMNRLESKGYVERVRSDVDRRQVLVHLTAKGRKAYRVHGLFHKRMVDSALDGLTQEEMEVFLYVLDRVKRFFDEENARASAGSR